MAARLGYGGLANTNGARDFSGKEEAEVVPVVGISTFAIAMQIGISIALIIGYGLWP